MLHRGGEIIPDERTDEKKARCPCISFASVIKRTTVCFLDTSFAVRSVTCRMVKRDMNYQTRLS